MRQAEAEQHFGKIAYEDSNYVVRVRVHDGLKVYIHRKDGKGEIKPRGYVLGSNSAWYKP